MDYILFDNLGNLIGIRGSIPNENENLQYVEWFDDFVNIIKPKLIEGILVETATDDDLQQIKNQQIEALKKLCHDELLPTDWYYIRERRGVPVPKEIEEQRQAILDKYDELISKI